MPVGIDFRKATDNLCNVTEYLPIVLGVVIEVTDDLVYVFNDKVVSGNEGEYLTKKYFENKMTLEITGDSARQGYLSDSMYAADKMDNIEFLRNNYLYIVKDNSNQYKKWSKAMQRLKPRVL